MFIWKKIQNNCLDLKENEIRQRNTNKALGDPKLYHSLPLSVFFQIKVSSRIASFLPSSSPPLSLMLPWTALWCAVFRCLHFFLKGILLAMFLSDISCIFKQLPFAAPAHVLCVWVLCLDNYLFAFLFESSSAFSIHLVVYSDAGCFFRALS